VSIVALMYGDERDANVVSVQMPRGGLEEEEELEAAAAAAAEAEEAEGEGGEGAGEEGGSDEEPSED
jgi:hypothetical protein